MDGMFILSILSIKSRDFVDGSLNFLNPSINYGFFMDGMQFKMMCPSMKTGFSIDWILKMAASRSRRVMWFLPPSMRFGVPFDMVHGQPDDFLCLFVHEVPLSFKNSQGAVFV